MLLSQVLYVKYINHILPDLQQQSKQFVEAQKDFCRKEFKFTYL